jgi:hypothetical protein
LLSLTNGLVDRVLPGDIDIGLMATQVLGQLHVLPADGRLPKFKSLACSVE